MSTAFTTTSAPAPVPVFHPDHPHNHHPNSYTAPPHTTHLPLGPQTTNVPRHLPTTTPPRKMRPRHPKTPGSDSDASGSSPLPTCFCGRQAGHGGIYCSIDCARSDAFSSLCYRPGHSRGESIESTASTTLSRDPSVSSESNADTDWDASSHYRRVARANLRRDERREERRRRRAEGSVASSAARSTTLSTASSAASSSRVPDLVGGHSRNPSTASTATSASSWSSLSRNASSASTLSVTSRRGYRGDAVEVIQEAEDEEYADSRPYPAPSRLPGMGHRRKPSCHARRRVADPLGMGKDMRDILEEIISMEKTFAVDDDIAESTPPPGLFTAVFDRPPRTPSPVPEKRYIPPPPPPGAPARGHRTTMSTQHLGAPLGMGAGGGGASSRPSSFMGHQSSLSESHTALYLATASPVAASRRSASPQLHSRNSLTFTPESAGPVLAPNFGARFDSPGMSINVTPSRRRPQVSPNASYADMGGWRFPSSVTSSSLASAASGGAAPSAVTSQVTPRGPSIANSFPHGRPSFAGSSEDEHHRVAPHLLWPHPPNLATPSFPTSPADTPSFFSHRAQREDVRLSPPRSGLRLGDLMGSGMGEDDEDVGMEVDDESTVHGHAYGHGHGFGAAQGQGQGEGGYLPVMFETEEAGRLRGW